jgi:hypothetical protein
MSPKRALRGAVLLSAAALAGAVLVPVAAHSAPTPVTSKQCGRGDRPETGVQGEVPALDQVTSASRQGYRCNLRPVATNDLGGRGGDIQLTWYKQCAYQTRNQGPDASDSVAVLDLSKPKSPRMTAVLIRGAWAGKGGALLGIHEGLHASEKRGILVVPIGTMISVYDLKRDCRHPVHLADYDSGPAAGPFHDPGPPYSAAGIHSGQLSPDGTLYYATDIGNGSPGTVPAGPCATVIDLANPRAPKLLLRWGVEYPCHDLDISPDGTRAYVGWYAPGYGYTAAATAAFGPAAPVSYAASGMRVVDVSDLHFRRPNPTVRILGELTGGRQHTEARARIAGRTYVIGAEEAYCPGGNPRLVDITDEHHPVEVSSVDLEINTLPYCARQLNRNGDLLLYMGHYLSVDDPSNAKLLFVSWYASGLRVFDIHDPHHPREVAYLNPAVGAGASRTHDWSTTYPRYIRETGQVWFGSRVTGLNVVELDPRLRPAYPRVSVSRRWSVGNTSRVAAARAAARSMASAEAPPAFSCSLPPIRLSTPAAFSSSLSESFRP